MTKKKKKSPPFRRMKITIKEDLGNVKINVKKSYISEEIYAHLTKKKLLQKT